MPQMDSIYAGFGNGAWLQVRRISDLNEDQRARLRAPTNADFAINLVRPTPSGDLPMRRIFQDRQDNEIGEIDLWNYGYDARKRPWYSDTMRSDRPHEPDRGRVPLTSLAGVPQTGAKWWSMYF